MSDESFYKKILGHATDACRELRDQVPDEPPTHDEYAEAAVKAILRDIEDIIELALQRGYDEGTGVTDEK